MCELMCHHDAPIYNSIGLVALLYHGEVQIVEVSVVEEEGFVLIESNCAAGVIVVDVYCIAFEGENVSTV